MWFMNSECYALNEAKTNKKQPLFNENGWRIKATPLCYKAPVSSAEANIWFNNRLTSATRHFVNNVREHVVPSLLPGLQTAAEVQAH